MWRLLAGVELGSLGNSSAQCVCCNPGAAAGQVALCVHAIAPLVPQRSQQVRRADHPMSDVLTHCCAPELPQVLVTPHTAFLTEEALNNICTTTIQNIADYVLDRPLGNEVKAQPAPAGKT